MSDRPAVPAGPARMRASTAERDHVVSLVRSHWDAGRLSDEELEERVGRALRARTLGQLRGLVDDLPGPPAAPPSRGIRGWRYAARTVTGLLKPTAKLAAGVFVTLLVIGILVGDDDEGGPRVGVSGSEPTELRLDRVRRGGTGVDGGLAFRVRGFRTADEVPQRSDSSYAGGVLAAPAGETFLVVTVDATNRTDQPADPFCGDLGAELFTRDRRGYELVDGTYKLAGNELMCSGGRLSPDELADYSLVFQVPDGARPRSIDLWSSVEEGDPSGRATRLRITI